jgi:hypothetical protein
MCDPYNGYHTAEDTKCRGTQNSNPVPVECEFKLEYGTPPDYKGIRKLYEQLRENGKVEKDISLHDIGDKMTMWIMFGRLANRVPRNPSPKRVRSYR